MSSVEPSRHYTPHVRQPESSGLAMQVMDRIAGVESLALESVQRQKRLLFLICAALAPVLPWLTSHVEFTENLFVRGAFVLGLVVVSGLFLAAIRVAKTVGLLGLLYGGFLIIAVGLHPLIMGEPDTVALVTLILVPMVMGFSSGAMASAVGTLMVLSLFYGVAVSGHAQYDPVTQYELSLLTYASVLTLACGVLVFAFAKLTQNESTMLNEDNARIRNMALTDPLTKLWNRRAFQVDMLKLTAQHGNGAIPALCILDLDGFKQINDTHGHDIGDAVLRAFSRRLKSVIKDGLEVYRLGGDEFAIVCADQPDLAELEKLGAKITVLTERPIKAQSMNIEFDVSVGIAVSDGSAKSIQSLYQQADMAAFVAKEKTGSHHIVFDKMLDSQANRKFEVERALKTAIEHRSINVAFQPQVDLRTGIIIGYEALARWRDPTLGSVSPGEFIEIAEESPLVKVLDRLIISKALQSAGLWLGEHQRVSVNASARSLNSHEFADFVVQQAKLSGLRPSQVEVEITETSLIRNWEQSKQTVESLRAAGMRIVLDDFGVGYSSLSYLVEFPVQKIKFDRSFLLKATDQASILVMQSIADLANKMKVDLIAEGIETMDQLKLLKSINCFAGQGYLLSRPILSEKMIEQFRSKRSAA